MPRSVQLETISHECVRLTWQQPEYPNGEITKYQVILNFVLYICNKKMVEGDLPFSQYIFGRILKCCVILLVRIPI